MPWRKACRQRKRNRQRPSEQPRPHPATGWLSASRTLDPEQNANAATGSNHDMTNTLEKICPSTFRGLLYAALVACTGFPPAAHGADVFKGETLYRTYCESCHGSAGRGVMPGTPNFASGQALMQSDLSLFRGISDGKQVMPGFQGVLSQYEILDVIAFLRTLH